jgi:hypothetical protein
MASVESQAKHRRSLLARHIWGSLATTLLLATVGSLGAAPSASATTNHTVDITLSDGSTPGCNATTVITSTTTAILASPGDTLTLSWNSSGVSGQVPGDDKVCGIGMTPVTSGGGLTGWVLTFPGGSRDLSSLPGIGFLGTVGTDTGRETLIVGAVSTVFNVYEGETGLSFGLIFTVNVTQPNPRPVEVSIELAAGGQHTCSTQTVVGFQGEWTNLPEANACLHSSLVGAQTLLGWATRSDFPVTLAQRQVDNGWGAYETFDDDGNLTGVFIPAGGATLLSNDNVLHAIWSN